MPPEAKETAIGWLQPRSALVRRRQYLRGRGGKLASGAREPAAQALGLLFGSCWTHRCPGSCSLPPSLTWSGTVFAAALRPVSGCVAAVSRAGATAEIGGSSCRHGAEKLRLRVPLAVPATVATVCRGYACKTDAS
eukprot:COSAG01_NODE_4579_length_4904_cov_13.838710_4_plen_136_part_00